MADMESSVDDKVQFRDLSTHYLYSKPLNVSFRYVSNYFKANKEDLIGLYKEGAATIDERILTVKVGNPEGHWPCDGGQWRAGSVVLSTTELSRLTNKGWFRLWYINRQSNPTTCDIGVAGEVVVGKSEPFTICRDERDIPSNSGISFYTDSMVNEFNTANRYGASITSASPSSSFVLISEEEESSHSNNISLEFITDQDSNMGVVSLTSAESCFQSSTLDQRSDPSREVIDGDRDESAGCSQSPTPTPRNIWPQQLSDHHLSDADSKEFPRNESHAQLQDDAIPALPRSFPLDNEHTVKDVNTSLSGSHHLSPESISQDVTEHTVNTVDTDPLSHSGSCHLAVLSPELVSQDVNEHTVNDVNTTLPSHDSGSYHLAVLSPEIVSQEITSQQVPLSPLLSPSSPYDEDNPASEIVDMSASTVIVERFVSQKEARVLKNSNKELREKLRRLSKVLESMKQGENKLRLEHERASIEKAGNVAELERQLGVGEKEKELLKVQITDLKREIGVLKDEMYRLKKEKESGEAVKKSILSELERKLTKSEEDRKNLMKKVEGLTEENDTLKTIVATQDDQEACDQLKEANETLVRETKSLLVNISAVKHERDNSFKQSSDILEKLQEIETKNSVLSSENMVYQSKMKYLEKELRETRRMSAADTTTNSNKRVEKKQPEYQRNASTNRYREKQNFKEHSQAVGRREEHKLQSSGVASSGSPVTVKSPAPSNHHLRKVEEKKQQMKPVEFSDKAPMDLQKVPTSPPSVIQQSSPQKNRPNALPLGMTTSTSPNPSATAAVEHHQREHQVDLRYGPVDMGRNYPAVKQHHHSVVPARKSETDDRRREKHVDLLSTASKLRSNFKPQEKRELEVRNVATHSPTDTAQPSTSNGADSISEERIQKLANSLRGDALLIECPICGKQLHSRENDYGVQLHVELCLSQQENVN